MKQLAVTQFPWPELVLVPLLLFFAIFVTVIVWTSLRKTQMRFSEISRLPLEGEDYE